MVCSVFIKSIELWNFGDVGETVTCPFSKMVDALPSRCSDWFWSDLICPGSFAISQMYCRVPHNYCMWRHTSFQLSSSLYTVHTLQYILQKSGLLWQRIFDPLWGLTGNTDVTWLLTGPDPKLFQICSWHHNPLNRTPLLQVSGVTLFCSYNKHASTNCSANCFSLYLFSMFHSIILCSCC